MANIPISQLREMFAAIKDDSGWDPSGDLLWGYFFTDPKPKKLERLADHLVQLGYRFVEVYETDDRSTHFLHVERIETHTPDSLFERNAQLDALALEYGIETYDGMDVGPVSGETD